MKFRIKKEDDGLYFAEYKVLLFWYYVNNSSSFYIEETRKACRRFKVFGENELIEVFKL